MANTYTQIHLQFVFAVKYRLSLIQPSWKEELYKYMTGIVQHYEHKLLIVNGMPDHVHLLIGVRPSQSVSELMKQVKGDSSKWINDRGFVNGKFQWQEGYGAFSYAKSDLPNVINYIQQQEEHHRTTTFMQEYKELLDAFEVVYDDKYIFQALI
ncbi:IS200/IS605 family transposase [Lacibacter sp. H407]|uniref:IS200/IS605 family transposase n=1 Tax=Lacibacter sp. H407 TaxID=3133423 RepID=UPI0030C35923